MTKATKTKGETVACQATRSFATYVAGDCISVAGGQLVHLPKDKADELIAAGYVVEGEIKGPKKEALGVGRVVSDIVPDPDDITDAEKEGTRDPVTGRDYVDPSIRRAREGAEKPEESIEQTDSAGKKSRAKKNPQSDAVQEPVVRDPEGTHTDPKDDGTAAKGSDTTGKRDRSKGPKPASEPVKTGQTTAHRKPRQSGEGPVDKPDPDLKEPDRSTVGDEPEKDMPRSPEKDEPVARHPSPGTVDPS